MPFALLPRSPLAGDGRPARVHYRERGAGPAVLLLHGGWGYQAYPYDDQLAALSGRFRAVAADRVGYGASGRVAALPDGFHQRMAEETLLVMDALGIAEAALWGHSDGSVVAAWCALLAPHRIRALVLEAFHFLCHKTASLDFFRTGAEAPERFGEPVVRALEEDHGESWREVVGMGARAWLRIIEEGRPGRRDLYQGRLGEVRAPTLLLHGSRDPRTEPGEIEAALEALPGSRLLLVDAGHSPHTSRSAAASTEGAIEFLAGVLDVG
jgi:pimeloyl-ACP methyl ester carboxylesterase